MHIKTLTVSQLNNYIKKTLDNDFILRNACIKGEISNFKHHSSGHLYFSLKDEYGKINCIMFKSDAKGLKFYPKDGDMVIIQGRVSSYSKEGIYQLYCNEMEQEGLGELFLTFEKLKEKLSKKGIFNESHKKTIPKFSKKVGVVTSPTGAAIKDIINVTKRRNPGLNLIIYPSLVQGERASLDIINGIKYFDKREDIDVIILARGGGSIEELWAFNNEDLAYTIYDCNKPIVSGVGHETDFTICDFASDLRVPTPSAAAEVISFDLYDINEKIKNYKDVLSYKMQKVIKKKFNKLENTYSALKLQNPINYIANEYIKIDNLRQNLTYKVKAKTDYEKEHLARLNSLLVAHNPLNILNKGYCVIEDSKDKVVSSVQNIKEINEVKIIFKDGKVKASIENVEDLK